MRTPSRGEPGWARRSRGVRCGGSRETRRPRPPRFGKPVVLRPRPSAKKIRRDAWTCALGTKITCSREHHGPRARPCDASLVLHGWRRRFDGTCLTGAMSRTAGSQWGWECGSRYRSCSRCCSGALQQRSPGWIHARLDAAKPRRHLTAFRQERPRRLHEVNQCPQRDSNPRYGLERAATWTASRWGRGQLRIPGAGVRR
jgi:hypothetical protein